MSLAPPSPGNSGAINRGASKIAASGSFSNSGAINRGASSFAAAGSFSNSGAINRGSSSFAAAGSFSSSGAINRGASSIAAAGSFSNSGAINRGPSKIATAGSFSSSGAINRGTSRIATAGSFSRSGAINRGPSRIATAGSFSSSGAINRGTSSVATAGSFRNSGAINRGPSRIATSGTSGSSGSIRRAGTGAGNPNTGSAGRRRKETKPGFTFQDIDYRKPLSGLISLRTIEDFDPDTGLPLPERIRVFHCDLNGIVWTPPDHTPYKAGPGYSETPDYRCIDYSTEDPARAEYVAHDGFDYDNIHNSRLVSSRWIDIPLPNASGAIDPVTKIPAPAPGTFEYLAGVVYDHA